MTKLEEAMQRYQEAERTASNAALAVIRARQEEQVQTAFGFLVPERPQKENPMKASRLTGGAQTKVKADKMGGPSVPKKESSIENRKSEHKLANLEMNTKNVDPMKGAIDRVPQLVRQRKRGSFE